MTHVNGDKSFGIDAKDRQVNEAVCPYDLCFQGPAIAEGYQYSLRPLYHMVVGEDVPLVVDDLSRPYATRWHWPVEEVQPHRFRLDVDH